ncbi:hypothetical protein [Parerythrobacter jejuensis]|uniref:Uncharacterized protein n=2 Tax=Parerythrobacter jejuensis TaxID=795812 RepID=A0A845ANQ7_9SPHN|nr:hypothetical protein [Parerythrobacter jejuensis]MXP32442.1 hypothetical protein [Parerythrobacter jejuensis]
MMTQSKQSQSGEAPVEAVMRDELAHGDVVLGTIGPILGHLLANHDHSLFSDEIIARVRGMLANLASQLLEAEGEVIGVEEPHDFALENQDSLATLLASNTALLTHCHAMAIESQLALRLQRRNSIDPVLSPLLQSLIASEDPAVASSAMAALAAQARFAQQQKRMQMPMAELPADLFHSAMLAWREHAGEIDATKAAEIETRLRKTFDESRGRLGLFSRLVSGMGAGARASLSVSHSGVGLFLSGLAAASGQDRDIVALSTNDRQLARLALALRAAGLNPKEVEEQFLYLHPEISLPHGFSELRVDRASQLLSSATGWQIG